MDKHTKQSIIDDIKTQDIRYIRLMFTDMLGTIKNVEVPAWKIEKVLNNEQMFDGSSIEGFVRIQEADMFLYPDLSTWLVLPWESYKSGQVARLICDIHRPNGSPFEGDPRHILKRQLTLMREQGFSRFNVGCELEFFLFKLDEQRKPTLEHTDFGGYFDLSPIDASENVRRDISLELQKLGFILEAAHHEVAYGQHEINFQFDNALEAADNIQTFKLVVKNVALRHGYHATFMPKPVAGINGSGMHTNTSLADLEGKNVFYDLSTKNKLSDIAEYFIGGILTHTKEFCLITNPTVNSYKRLIPGYEAPVYIAWSEANRSSLIRIPATRGQSTRVEIRSVDPTANPYLAFASILASGLDGIMHQTKIKPIEINLFNVPQKERDQMGIESVPSSLEEAIKEFKKGTLIKDVLGKHLTEKLLDAKQKEWDSYKTHISQWEIDEYLSKY